VSSRPYRQRPDQRCTYGVSRSGAANGERNLHPLAALLSATFLIALLEALRASGAYPGAGLFAFPQALALSLAGLMQTFVPTCAFFAALAGLATAREGSLRFERFRLIAYVLISAAVVGCAFRNLALYPPLAAYVPGWFAFLALFAFIAWTCLRESMPPEPAEGRWAELRYRFVPGLALGGALACLVLERFLYREQYLSLHLGQLQVAHLLLGLGLWQVLARTPAVSGRTRRISWIVALVLLVGSAALASTSLLDPVRPYYLSRSVPGRAQALFQPYQASREVPRAPVPDDPEAGERFRRLSKLPLLPSDFELARYNVLLLVSDSTRFDQTSLEQPEIGSTPHLAALVNQGAFSFSRAYSPSNATFQAVSAVLGMSYPSMLEIETWNKPWKGRLHDAVLTAPELFRLGGYDTFWVSHDFGYCFSSFMLGLDSRFAQRAVMYGDMYDKAVDRHITDTALAALGSRVASRAPFFGVVFLGSPHAPYLVQRRTRPEHTELQRYRQEIREVDEQIGRILRLLLTSALGPRTIVIYMGDHGEEFAEHGGQYHGGTVYSEAIHVPLVVWVPGLEGRRISEPTSTSYVLPWLLSHGPPQVRAAVSQHLRHTLGPMLRATNGAVLSEMLGHDLIKSTLIYPDRKFIYDFLADRHEAYRLDQDPGEHADRFNVDAALSADARSSVAAFREVRAARRRFILRPDVLDPRDAAF